MLAIFLDEKSAMDFSNKIHEYLKANRPGYSAERWSYPNKSDFEEKWMVKVPFDYQQWPVKLKIDTTVKETIPIADAKVFLSTWVTPIKEIDEKVIVKSIIE